MIGRLGLIGCVALSLLACSVGWARDLSQLTILKDNYPRVFFFRASESAVNVKRYPTFESWDTQFDRLEGIMGKCLDEECVGRIKRNPKFFSEFKVRHPHQVVLLHFNGNARDPRFETGKYFAGDWIYRAGITILQDVPAEAGETVIHVANARDFHTNIGRYRNANDDIGLFRLTADGKDDWYHSEQVQLVAVDDKANTITVRRGCYGTKPLSFQAGKARAAAHMVEGPWGRYNHLLWFYNFSTACPRDRDGKNCADRLVDDLAGWFGPKGILAALDGVEFDVCYNQTRGDTDGDGKVDNGIIDGINKYGIGVYEFAHKLRQRMGAEFIIQADGALGPGGGRSQRCWGILNGIESEGWPNINDWDFKDWSGGLNRHNFWQVNAFKPAFNYINHKWIEPVPGKPGQTRHPAVPFSRDRLAFAAAQFTDSMICYSLAPKPDPDGKYGIWDEFREGVADRLGWLGHPEGPAIHLATRTPDLMGERGQGEGLRAAISGRVVATLTPGGVRIVSADPNAKRLKFAIKGVRVKGPDLFVQAVLSGAPMTGYPPAMARFAKVGVAGGMIDLMSGEPLQIGMKLRGAKREVPLDPSTGACYINRPRNVGGVTLPTIFTHPPWRGVTGYTFWVREVQVPKNAELRFSLGMGKKSPERSDGVWFSVDIAVVGADGTVGEYKRIFEKATKQFKWLPQVVSLTPYAGKRVHLKFIADCGPHNNSTTDHAHWGDVRIVTRGTTPDQITRSVYTMTWVNSRPFTCGFYFRDIRSRSVDLSFDIEGSEPVVLKSVDAYAHADAMVRVFQNGIVLGNPSPRPYTFDLAELTPGRHYRRFQATANQDTKTNNGQPVGATVTLGGLDGLFLVRTK